MQNVGRYICRALIAFSPSIVLLLIAYSGHVSGDSLNGLSTAVALIQGIVLLPFLVWMWIDFRRNPEKYPAPGWLIRFLDIAPLAFVVLTLAYFYMHRSL
ncbi:MAG: hypothetical protein Q7J75_01320 [Rhodoferax sp.]|nr:hypothetical protein [Rhodoferax sp.]